MDRLAKLVQNLLDMSRIEAGILDVNGELYSLKNLCQEVVDSFHPPLNGRIQTHLESNLPLVWMDLSAHWSLYENTYSI